MIIEEYSDGKKKNRDDPKSSIVLQSGERKTFMLVCVWMKENFSITVINDGDDDKNNVMKETEKKENVKILYKALIEKLFTHFFHYLRTHIEYKHSFIIGLDEIRFVFFFFLSRKILASCSISHTHTHTHTIHPFVQNFVCYSMENSLNVCHTN